MNSFCCRATNDMLGKGIFNHFWAAALYRLVADCLTSTAPIVMRELISFLQDSYSSSYSGQPSPNIGKGVALSIALFGMQLIGTLCTSQFFYHGASSGCLFRAGLMKALYDRAVTLSPTARAKIPNAKLYAHTVDISRIDLACNFFMSIWAAPFQICLCLALLIVNLGYSALPGFAVFLLIFPIQHRITKMLFSARKKCMVWSDQRAKLVTEMLTGIRIVKSFSYEKPFLKKLFDIRKNELVYVRRILLSRAGNVSIAFTLPILSAVVSFLVYSASGHELTPGVIFSSFSLFQLLRQPLMMLPQALNSTTDAISSFQRLIPTLTAEVLPEQDLNAKHDASVGVSCENASFTWESSKPPEPFNPKAAKKGDRKKTGITKDRSSTEKSEKDEPPFKIEGVNLKITPGELVAIVGSVGSGKSSLISGLLGEMRRTSGTLSFGGKVAYIPQTAWAFNGSVRENILFGQPFDLHRYQQVLHDACLLDDLSIFDDGDMTEIGENGITLSGELPQYHLSRATSDTNMYQAVKNSLFPVSASHICM